MAPGIFCKLMATDTERHRESTLVRLLPGVDYPAHTHARLEELFLLDGELWIDDRKLYPGDYNRAEAGSGDKRVSATFAIRLRTAFASLPKTSGLNQPAGKCSENEDLLGK